MEQNQLRLVTQSCCIQQLLSCAIILSVYDVNLNNWSGQLIVFSLDFYPHKNTRTQIEQGANGKSGQNPHVHLAVARFELRELGSSKALNKKSGQIRMYTWQLPDLRRLGWDRARP